MIAVGRPRKQTKRAQYISIHKGICWTQKASIHTKPLVPPFVAAHVMHIDAHLGLQLWTCTKSVLHVVLNVTWMHLLHIFQYS